MEIINEEENRKKIRDLLISEWIKSKQKYLDPLLWVMTDVEKEEMIKDTVNKILELGSCDKDKLLKQIHSLYNKMKNQKTPPSEKNHESEIQISKPSEN